MYRGKSIAVVVPTYNESKLVRQTLSSIPPLVDRVYAVDDASTDATLHIMLEQSERDKRITVIPRKVNGGVGASIVSGYKMAMKEGIDIAVVMAGDGQMDPQYLPHLIDPIVEGRAEYVKGNRLSRTDLRAGMSTWRYFGNVVLTYLNMVASGYWNVVDPQNGYTAITTRALSLLDLDRIYPRYAFENDMLVKLNVYDVPVTNVPIPAKYGDEESKISYGSFIVKTLAFFVRSYCWRIRTKYFSRSKSDKATTGRVIDCSLPVATFQNDLMIGQPAREGDLSIHFNESSQVSGKGDRVAPIGTREVTEREQNGGARSSLIAETRNRLKPLDENRTG